MRNPFNNGEEKMTEATDHARQQAQAQLESIKEMVTALDAENEQEREAALQRIYEDPLSLEVRSDWYSLNARKEDTAPSEYRILLCTGGPAVQIIGDLNQHQQPESARLQYQDWFTPWEDCALEQEDEQALLTYAQQFYFGQ
jgi:hypothetical protein